MITRFKPQFSKDVARLPTSSVKAEIAAVIQAVEAAANLSSVPNIKKLRGYKTAYRIRVGDFRIGVVLLDQLVVFVRVANRRDIYKLFP